MTKNEVIKLLEKINTSYPYYFKSKTQEDKQNIVTNWYDTLKDKDIKTIEERLDNYIENNKYAPTIADILYSEKKKVKTFNNYTEELTPEDIKIMRDNYRKYGAKYLNKTQEEIEKDLEEC